MSVAPLDKCTVTGAILRADGSPIHPATVVFQLSGRDRDGDVTILPDAVRAKTDADGNISADLWPNARGLAESIYTVVVSAGGRSIGQPFRIVVPDAPAASLADIAELVPPPSVDDAMQQVVLARSARDEAREARDAAAASADTAADAADAATAQAGIATAAAGTATDMAGSAAAAAQAASDDADAAAGLASAAADSAALAAAWAEGHEPGGPGTKSAHEWAEEAADTLDGTARLDGGNTFTGDQAIAGALGVNTAPQARVHSRVEAADVGRAFLMTGKGITGTEDPAHGAVFVLSHNVTGNRQFVLGNSESGLGVRIIGTSLDGYNFLSSSRQHLQLGASDPDGRDVTAMRNLYANGHFRTGQWARVGSYTVAALPSAATAGPGAIVFVSDEAGGATLAFSDGTNWRRVTDRAVVS